MSIFITTFRDNTSSGMLLELPPFVFCFLLLVCLVEEVELPLAGSMVKIYYISQVWSMVYVSVCGILLMLIKYLACLYIKVNSCVYLQEANHAASIAFSVTPFQNQRHVLFHCVSLFYKSRHSHLGWRQQIFLITKWLEITII